MELIIAKKVLAANDEIAAANQALLKKHRTFGINLLGSPGAGKTSLVEALAQKLKGEIPLSVIEGDLATTRDAERVEKLGIPVVQINTGGACHLDAGMVAQALEKTTLPRDGFLIIENVGNLVCPSSYRLGEHLRVVVLSVPEGDDKVAKYPTMFGRVDVIVINKIDLSPYVPFDRERVKGDIKKIAPDTKLFTLSAKTDEGMESLVSFLKAQLKEYLAHIA